MKDFRFLSAVARNEQEIPIIMEGLLAPYEGKILAFHHDITMRGQQFIVSYTVQLHSALTVSNGSQKLKKH